jgi:hypothetical protein
MERGGRKQNPETVPRRYRYGPTRVSSGGAGRTHFPKFPDGGGGEQKTENLNS